jgi:hypothetical protein
MNHAKRRDANEAPIVAALRAVGAAVQQLDGAGVPDLLVEYRGKLRLIEVKNPDTKGGGKYNTGEGHLTAAQTKWRREWKGTMPTVVTSIDEALAAIGAVMWAR